MINLNNINDKELKQLLTNDNINIFNDQNNDLYVEVYSYNTDLAENEKTAKNLFNRIKKYKEDILSLYNKDYFIISIDSYSIDGLYQSNSNLLFKDSKIYNLY